MQTNSRQENQSRPSTVWKIDQISFLAFWFILANFLGDGLASGILIVVNPVAAALHHEGKGWPVLFSTAITHFLIFLGIWIARPKKPLFRSLGFSLTRGKDVIKFTIYSLGLSFVFIGITHFIPPKTPPPIEHIIQGPSDVIFLVMMATLIGPLVEESLFRGILYPYLRSQFSIPLAIFLNSFIFAALHILQLGTYYLGITLIFVLAVCLSWIREKTSSTTLCWWFHLVYNFVWGIYACMHYL